MGITVYWDTEQKRIIRQNYEPHWNWQDYQEAFRLTSQLVHEVNYPICMIAEVADIVHIPPNAVIYGSQAILGLPPNIVLVVVITHSNQIKTLFNVITKVVRFKKAVFASTVDEARILIAAAIIHRGEGK